MAVPTVMEGRVTSILVVLAPHGLLHGACDLLGHGFVHQMFRSSTRPKTERPHGNCCHIIDFLQHTVRWRRHLHMQGALALMIQVLGQLVECYVAGQVVVTEKQKSRTTYKKRRKQKRLLPQNVWPFTRWLSACQRSALTSVSKASQQQWVRTTLTRTRTTVR